MSAEYLEKIAGSELSDMPPWMFVTSPILAKAIGVHLQTLSNWRLREVGPPPAPASWFRGRAARYNLGHVISWAYEKAGRALEPWEVNAGWLRDRLQFADWRDHDAVQKRVQLLMSVGREFRPQDLTPVGRRELFPS